MNLKINLLIQKIKRIVPLFIWNIIICPLKLNLKEKIENFINVNIRKRVPFTYDSVVTGLGTKITKSNSSSFKQLPYFSARLYREVKLLKEAIGTYHAKKSIEIGCGYGRLTPWIAEHSDQHYAIEPEYALLNAAKKLYPKVNFFQTKAQKLPFPDSYFDLCVSWTVLQHIPPKELIKAVSEIKRICKPNAIIILTEAVRKKKRVDRLGYWEYTLQEWVKLFSPWKITFSTLRKLEEPHKAAAGLVMRFERNT
ncbi:MAG: class I SAM-dependent methyltransferase [Candidatus Hodarchaeota archaeon]